MQVSWLLHFLLLVHLEFTPTTSQALHNPTIFKNETENSFFLSTSVPANFNSQGSVQMFVHRYAYFVEQFIFTDNGYT